MLNEREIDPDSYLLPNHVRNGNKLSSQTIQQRSPLHRSVPAPPDQYLARSQNRTDSCTPARSYVHENLSSTDGKAHPQSLYGHRGQIAASARADRSRRCWCWQEIRRRKEVARRRRYYGAHVVLRGNQQRRVCRWRACLGKYKGKHNFVRNYYDNCRILY